MAKYLDATGLGTLWSTAKSTFLTPGGGDNRYLKLSGGVLTGNIQWTTDSHGIYFFGSCGIEKMSGYGPALVGEGNAEFSITASNDRTASYRILHSGNWNQVITLSSLGAASSSHTHSYLPLSGGSLSGI